MIWKPKSMGIQLNVQEGEKEVVSPIFSAEMAEFSLDVDAEKSGLLLKTPMPKIGELENANAKDEDDHPKVFVDKEIGEAGIFDCIIDPTPTNLLISELKTHVDEKVAEVKSALKVELKNELGGIKAQLEDIALMLKQIAEK